MAFSCHGFSGESLLLFVVDHLEDAVVLLQVDVELDVSGLVAACLRGLFVALEGLQDLECALDDTFDGSIFVDFFREVFVLYCFKFWFSVALLRSGCALLLLLCDLFVVFGGDEDFFCVEGLFAVEVFDICEGLFEGDQLPVLVYLHEKSNLREGYNKSIPTLYTLYRYFLCMGMFGCDFLCVY